MGAETSCDSSYSYENYTTNIDSVGTVVDYPAIDSMSFVTDSATNSVSGHSTGSYVPEIDTPIYVNGTKSDTSSPHTCNSVLSSTQPPSCSLVYGKESDAPSHVDNSELSIVTGPSHNFWPMSVYSRRSSSRGYSSRCKYDNTGTTNAERGAYEYGHLKGFDDAICGTTDVSKDNGASYLLPATTQHGNKGYRDGYEEACVGLDTSNQVSQRSPPSSPPNSPGRDFRAD